MIPDLKIVELSPMSAGHGAPTGEVSKTKWASDREVDRGSISSCPAEPVGGPGEGVEPQPWPATGHGVAPEQVVAPREGDKVVEVPIGEGDSSDEDDLQALRAEFTPIPQVSSSGESASEVAQVEVCASSLKPGKLLVAPVQVDGRNANALLDSGATSTLIRQSLAPSTMGASAVVIEGLGSSRIAAIGSVQVALQLGQLNLDVGCTVVPDGAIGHDLVLGEDFLLAHKVKVDLANCRVQGSCQGGGSSMCTCPNPGQKRSL